MFLSETHVKKLREIATENGWRFTRALRNVVYLNADEGDFQTRVQIRRTNEGGSNVSGTLGCVFNGTEADFVLFMNQCLAQSAETTKVRQLTQEYLDKEVAACTPFKIEQLERMGRLIVDFPGWLDPISRVSASDRGLTAVDPVSQGLFEGAENIDLALQGGRLEVDSEPDSHVVVWVSRDYLYPLAKQISDYLTSEGMTSTISTVEVFFDG
jgi:hypothetical protein